MERRGRNDRYSQDQIDELYECLVKSANGHLSGVAGLQRVPSSFRGLRARFSEHVLRQHLTTDPLQAGETIDSQVSVRELERLLGEMELDSLGVYGFRGGPVLQLCLRDPEGNRHFYGVPGVRTRTAPSPSSVR